MIQFFLTGGTIDSRFDGVLDTAVTREKSVVPDFIKNLKLHEKSSFQTICMKDSRSLNLSDRKKLCAAIKKSRAKKIIVTHGTYTMPDTAKFLEANLKENNKKIILIGSMVPLEGFSPSDAGFNLGFAIAKLDEVENGVWVAMNGKVFTPQEIVKNLNVGRFTSIFIR